jgi:hypothetical protein
MRLPLQLLSFASPCCLALTHPVGSRAEEVHGDCREIQTLPGAVPRGSTLSSSMDDFPVAAPRGSAAEDRQVKKQQPLLPEPEPGDLTPQQRHCTAVGTYGTSWSSSPVCRSAALCVPVPPNWRIKNT